MTVSQYEFDKLKAEVESIKGALSIVIIFLLFVIVGLVCKALFFM